MSQRVLRSEATWATPIRSIPELVQGTLDSILKYVGHQEAFAGFTMLLALGFYATLCVNVPRSNRSPSDSLTLTSAPLSLGLIVQLVFVPILWSHLSDSRQVFGRFSYTFMSVIILNAALTIAFAVTIWRRRSLVDACRRNKDALIVYGSVTLTVFSLLFVLAQFRSIHYKAATYLFTSALVTIAMLCWQLTFAVSDQRARKVGQVALSWLLMTLIIMAAQVLVSLYIHGTVTVRIMAGSAFMQVTGGLFWGCFLGLLIKHACVPSENIRAWMSRMKGLSIAIIIVICVGIVNGRAKSIPYLATLAVEWDDRHELLLGNLEQGPNRY